MQPHETKAGPGGGAPEPRCIAQQASAVPGYSQTGQDSNPIGPGAERTPATIVQPEVWKFGFGIVSHSGIPT
jgi:hypothetical protein